MSDNQDYEDRRTVVLEGMYKGVAGKIDELRATMERALAATADEMETVVQEIRYLSQQNSAIYDNSQAERGTMQEAILEALDKRVAESAVYLEERLEEKFEALKTELLETLRAVPAREEGSAAPTEAGLDYDTLAEKIASAVPEPDFDFLAEKIATAFPQPEAIAEKVATAVNVSEEVAEKVASNVPAVDYDLVAERVAGVLEDEFEVSVDKEGIAAITGAIVGALDYERIAKRVAELLEESRPAPTVVERIVETVPAEPVKSTPIPVETVKSTPTPVETVPAEPEPEPEPEPKPEPVTPTPMPVAPAAAVAPVAPAEPVKPTPVPVRSVSAPVVAMPSEEDSNLTTRLKRSFSAKIIESDPEIKQYYSVLKNAFLAYPKIVSQVNWSNDRFAYLNETVAKVGVRGKTLCLYLALNPEEFPESVYHQKFAGDTKMYEKTPLMMKIKSGVGLKRALRLVELLMERLGAVKEERAPVDYAAQYAFRSEEELLREGLIKTALVEKSDLDF